jgi:hypothetical protein
MTATTRLALVVFLHGASDPTWRARNPEAFEFWRDAAGITEHRAEFITGEEAKTMLAQFERLMSGPDSVQQQPVPMSI